MERASGQNRLLDRTEGGKTYMTDQSDSKTPAHQPVPPAATHSRGPDRELELKLRKNPEDLDSKADVGSDQSMDASDPSAATQPGGNEPVPSSSFPEDE
jgi:hypothetical protein